MGAETLCFDLNIIKISLYIFERELIMRYTTLDEDGTDIIIQKGIII